MGHLQWKEDGRILEIRLLLRQRHDVEIGRTQIAEGKIGDARRNFGGNELG